MNVATFAEKTLSKPNATDLHTLSCYELSENDPNLVSEIKKPNVDEIVVHSLVILKKTKCGWNIYS